MEGVTEAEPFGGEVETPYSRKQRGVYGRIIHGRVVLIFFFIFALLFFLRLFALYGIVGIRIKYISLLVLWL